MPTPFHSWCQTCLAWQWAMELARAQADLGSGYCISPCRARRGADIEKNTVSDYENCSFLWLPVSSVRPLSHLEVNHLWRLNLRDRRLTWWRGWCGLTSAFTPTEKTVFEDSVRPCSTPSSRSLWEVCLVSNHYTHTHTHNVLSILWLAATSQLIIQSKIEGEIMLRAPGSKLLIMSCDRLADERTDWP